MTARRYVVAWMFGAAAWCVALAGGLELLHRLANGSVQPRRRTR